MAASPLLLALLVAAVLTIFLIFLLTPVLVRYAMARPNARSSHKLPTPQGGGIAILAAVLIVVTVGVFFTPWSPWCCGGRGFRGLVSFIFQGSITIVLASAVTLAMVGVFDDIHPLPALPRLALQFLAVMFVVGSTDIRLFPDFMPSWLETTILIAAGVWFVNLVNFMDGIDWITVAEMIPITAFLTILGVGIEGFRSFDPIEIPLLAAALCGALIGFAFFNKPVAKLFLGDVGSLPIGLLVGWLLLQLAGNGALAAAILLPLYYLADATITLLRRLARREKVWEAHRSHFYQQATANGFSVMAVSAQVFALNIALAMLAAWTILMPTPLVQVAGLVAGCILVGWLLRRFATKRREVSP
jgi:UDP-N-acetylmuramyl pentapeptide phosphotransferase/UDP-N-acetylglucosamine-1-phosphate transferase